MPIKPLYCTDIARVFRNTIPPAQPTHLVRNCKPFIHEFSNNYLNRTDYPCMSKPSLWCEACNTDKEYKIDFVFSISIVFSNKIKSKYI